MLSHNFLKKWLIFKIYATKKINFGGEMVVPCYAGTMLLQLSDQFFYAGKVKHGISGFITCATLNRLCFLVFFLQLACYILNLSSLNSVFTLLRISFQIVV